MFSATTNVSLDRMVGRRKKYKDEEERRNAAKRRRQERTRGPVVQISAAGTVKR